MTGRDVAGLRGASSPDSVWAMLAGSALLNRSLAIVALLTLSFVPIFGTAAAAMFIAASAACLVLRPAEIGKALLHLGPLFTLPLLAILSTTWSDAPEQTLRAALQLLITFVAAIVICRRMPASLMVFVLFCASCAVLLLASTTINRSLSSGLPFLGPFASKNAMGYAALIHLGLAAAVLLDGTHRWIWRLAALASLPVALVMLVLTQSAGSSTSGALLVALFLILALFGKAPMPVRLGLVGLAGVLAALGVLFASDITEAVNAFRVDVLHKDASLTGRTYLWDYAAELSRQRPLLGHGYYAFWRQGNIEAEGLWRWGGIASRKGFNFHNAVVETNVDLGLVGVAVLLGSCVGVLGIALYRQLASPSLPLAFLVALTVVLYMRSAGESGIIAPFTPSTVLWVATAYYALRSQAAARQVRRPGTRGTPRMARVPRFAAGRP